MSNAPQTDELHLVLDFSTDMPLGHAAINRRFVARGVLSAKYRTARDDLANALAKVWGSPPLVATGTVQKKGKKKANVVYERVGAGTPPLQGEVAVEIDECWAKKHREGAAKGLWMGDIDSPIKCFLDALQHAGVYENDAQVTCLLVNKSPSATQSRIRVYTWTT